MQKSIFISSDEPTAAEASSEQHGSNDDEVSSPSGAAQPHEIILASPTASIASEKSTQSDGWVTAEAGSVTSHDDGESSKTLHVDSPTAAAAKPWEVMIAEQLLAAQAQAKNIESNLTAELTELKRAHAAQLATLHTDNETMRAQLDKTRAFLATQATVLSEATSLTAVDTAAGTTPTNPQTTSTAWLWRILCPSWFSVPRETLAKSRLNKHFGTIAAASRGGAAYIASPSTKSGWATRILTTAVALFAGGRYARTHHHVLLHALTAVISRARLVLTKRRLAHLGVASAASAATVYLLRPPSSPTTAATANAATGTNDDNAGDGTAAAAHTSSRRWYSSRLATTRDAVSKSAVGKQLSSLSDHATKAIHFTANPTTKLGASVRGLLALIMIVAGGRFVRTHHQVLITRPLRAVRARLPTVSLPRVHVSFQAAPDMP